MAERLISCLVAAVLCGCTSLASPTVAPASPVVETPGGLGFRTCVAERTPTESAAPASPTASEAPTPGPEGLEVLDLEVTGCPGGVALDWSPATHPASTTTPRLRSLEPEVAPDYPPIAPAVDWGDSYGTDRFVTSAVDATLIPSEAFFFYRVMAYDDRNQAGRRIGRGPHAPDRGGRPRARRCWSRARREPPGSIGACTAGWGAASAPTASSSAGTGTPRRRPLTVMSSQSSSEIETPALHSGETYSVRVDAVRTTTLGSFVVARTSTEVYTAP